MSQAWLQVIGLALDFLGFALIAWEWFLAQRHDAALRAIEQADARRAESVKHLQRASQNSNPAMQRHLEMSEEVQRRLSQSKAGVTRERYGGMRTRAVVTGMALVLLGFVCQMLAAVPGCCPAIGIVPGG